MFTRSIILTPHHSNVAKQYVVNRYNKSFIIKTTVGRFKFN